MNLTKEMLLERRAALQQQFTKLINDGNAVQGAIQDCDYWLMTLDQDEKADEDIKTTTKRDKNQGMR